MKDKRNRDKETTQGNASNGDADTRMSEEMNRNKEGHVENNKNKGSKKGVGSEEEEYRAKYHSRGHNSGYTGF